MSLFDYLDKHPIIGLLYLALLVAVASVFRPVSVRSKVSNIVQQPERDDREEGAPEEEEDEDVEPPATAAGDHENDPTGKEREKERIRDTLATGFRTYDVVSDIAEPIALTFRDEGWRVRVEPVPPGPFAGLSSQGPNRARLTFVWGGEGAQS